MTKHPSRIPLTFEDLKKHEWCATVVEAFEGKYGSPLSIEFQDYLVDFLGNTEGRINQQLNWIEQTKKIVWRISEDKAVAEEYPLLWIRLWSLIFEYHPEMMERRELYSKTFMKDYIEYLNEFVTLFTEIDRNVIVYLRHHNTHMTVNSIRMSAKFSEDNVKVRLAKYPDAERVMRETLDQHNWNQQDLAKDLCLRIRDTLYAFCKEAKDVHTQKI